MPSIDQLSEAPSLAADDKLPVFLKGANDTRAASLATVASCVQSLIAGEPDETLYSLTTDGGGFVVAVLPTAPGGSVWAQIALSAPAATGVIALPGADDRAHGQEVLVTCTNAVTALTVSGSGATVYGAPASLAAHGFFRLRFDSISTAWYRVG